MEMSSGGGVGEYDQVFEIVEEAVKFLGAVLGASRRSLNLIFLHYFSRHIFIFYVLLLRYDYYQQQWQ